MIVVGLCWLVASQPGVSTASSNLELDEQILFIHLIIADVHVYALAAMAITPGDYVNFTAPGAINVGLQGCE